MGAHDRHRFFRSLGVFNKGLTERSGNCPLDPLFRRNIDHTNNLDCRKTAFPGPLRISFHYRQYNEISTENTTLPQRSYRRTQPLLSSEGYYPYLSDNTELERLLVLSNVFTSYHPVTLITDGNGQSYQMVFPPIITEEQQPRIVFSIKKAHHNLY